MICPFCEYEHGWSNKSLDIVKGECGNFYYPSNEIVMHKEDSFRNSCRGIYGCPKCNKLFIC